MSGIAVWEYRINAEGVTPEQVIASLEGVAKKYVFQLEKGDENGYLHYQGRISLIKKRRYAEKVKHLLPLFKNGLVPNFLEPTIDSERKNEAFYCVKEDTRLAGPWKDTDEVKILTHQLKLFKEWELRPYQATIHKQATTFSMRNIHLVYDPKGNCGKSLFSEFMEYEGIAEEVPPFRMMDDIFTWVCSRPIKQCYIFDLPRGMKKDKLGDLYSGIEVIKNGVAYDKRYNAKKIRFNRPNIYVFTNTLPNLDLMSRDRWRVWTVNNSFELVKYDFGEKNETLGKVVLLDGKV